MLIWNMTKNQKSQLNIIYFELKCKYKYLLMRYLISRLFQYTLILLLKIINSQLKCKYKFMH